MTSNQIDIDVLDAEAIMNRLAKIKHEFYIGKSTRIWLITLMGHELRRAVSI